MKEVIITLIVLIIVTASLSFALIENSREVKTIYVGATPGTCSNVTNCSHSPEGCCKEET